MKRRVKAPKAARAPRRSGTPRLAPTPVAKGRRQGPDYWGGVPVVPMFAAVWREMRGRRFSSL